MTSRSSIRLATLTREVATSAQLLRWRALIEHETGKPGRFGRTRLGITTSGSASASGSGLDRTRMVAGWRYQSSRR